MTTNPGHQKNYYSALKSDPIVDPEYGSDSDSTSSSSTSSSSSRSTSSSSNSDSTYSDTYSHTDTINDLNDELDRKESVIKQKDRKATRLISIIREKNMEIENLQKKNLDTQRSAWQSLADKNKELYSNSITVGLKIFQITWIRHGKKRTTKATSINFVSGMIA